ncbi:MAG: hypothetical protein N2593_03410 [Patescibacteria group bacterium]|nr:hypothetical protein [Patescibacteria group bacterium]
MNKKIIYIFLFLFFLVLISLFFGLYEVKFINTKASLKISSFSQDNSYVFITPLQAKANGQEKIRVTVFVLDERGLGVFGKKVYISPNQFLNIEEIQGLTDNFGKAYFDISSFKSGEYYLKIFIDNIELKQKINLSYY